MMPVVITATDNSRRALSAQVVLQSVRLLPAQ
jgi:hypothetical protein